LNLLPQSAKGELPALRVLLAIDPTDSSSEVVTQVAARPWPPDTVAIALTVIELAAVPPEVWEDAAGDVVVVRREMESRADAILSRAISELTLAGLKAEAMIHYGDPRVDIVDVATNWSADFIFVGTHTFKGVTRWLLGSVSKAVLRDAHCSVEIVRSTLEDVARYSLRGMKILLAADGSEFSEFAAVSVAQRPWPNGSEVRVISVDEPFQFEGEKEFKSIEEFYRKESMEPAEKAAHDAMKIITEAGLKATALVLGGYPKAAILEEAKDWGADLIVVGSHGKRGIERILLGSVSEAVALHADCSVEVIRNPALFGQS